MQTPTQRSVVLALAVLLASLFVFAGWARAGVGVAVTPTAFAYLPVIYKQPTPTPTATQPPSGDAIIGELLREDPNKPTYATHIEDIWFYDLIHNVSGSTVYFGVLGVNVEGPAPYFKTLWDGAGAPGGVLSINAGCWGPNGIPCAPDADAGRQRASLRVTAPGHYRLVLYICLSPFSACTSGGGDWRGLASVEIDAIDWTPQAPGTSRVQIQPEDVCRLLTNERGQLYLSCPSLNP